MIIKNGKIFGEDGAFHEGSIKVADGRFAEVLYCDKAACETAEASADCVMDVEGCYVIPGLVDIHFHGCKGYDFCDGTSEAFAAIAEYEAANGVTTIAPATMTLSREKLAGIFKAVREYNEKLACPKQDDNTLRSTIRGINMEGPFVSMAKKGAQNGAYIHVPDREFFGEMQELCGGLIKHVAVAPEEDPDLTFIREISKETVISVAHTTANYDTASKAFEAGASHVTHLFNAMPPFAHRDPGVVGAAFDHKDVFVELICDGVHIHPAMVRTVFTMFGPERVCMISDSMMATGMPDGDYSLGGQAVGVKGKLATLADGTIAGSASNLYDCLKVAVQQMGIPLEQAVLACTSTPARSIRLEDSCGSIRAGLPADFVVLDEELNIKMVVKDGVSF